MSFGRSLGFIIGTILIGLVVAYALSRTDFGSKLFFAVKGSAPSS